ncbi:class I SAM-dependent methyltransferase [Litoricolaceae bacterium]|nr:class I SAM-dependent methyltransferase [Litorivicinaceae bacterium]
MRSDEDFKCSLWAKVGFAFEERSKLLNVGCGGGADLFFFIEKMNLDVVNLDIEMNLHPDLIATTEFLSASVLDLPIEDDVFDYVVMSDVLHHVDETSQLRSNHVKALSECYRVLRPGGVMIVLEGNRYNPISYFHMVKHLGHNHFTFKYFKKLFDGFENVEFKSFEAHHYPWLLGVFRIYEVIMEQLMPDRIKSYNCAIVSKNGNDSEASL